MIEVERKFPLSEEHFASIKTTLEKQFGVAKPKHQIDTIFLFQNDAFDTYKRGDPVMRVRSSDGSLSLTYKRTINDDGDRIEHELSIDSAEEAQGLLTEIGYKQAVIVDKTRFTYSTSGMTAVLDEVKELGYFLEVEVLCKSDTEIVQSVAKIMEFAKQFGLAEDNVEQRKYDEMIGALMKPV